MMGMMIMGVQRGSTRRSRTGPPKQSMSEDDSKEILRTWLGSLGRYGEAVGVAGGRHEGVAEMKTRESSDRLRKASDIAEILGVSEKMVYRWAETGHLPCVKISPRCLRFDPAEIREWLDSRKRRGKTERRVGKTR